MDISLLTTKASNLNQSFEALVVHEKPECVPACKMNDYNFPRNSLGNLGLKLTELGCLLYNYAKSRGKL